MTDISACRRHICLLYFNWCCQRMRPEYEASPAGQTLKSRELSRCYLPVVLFVCFVLSAESPKSSSNWPRSFWRWLQQRKPRLYPRLFGLYFCHHRVWAWRQDIFHCSYHGHALQPPHCVGRRYAGPRTHDLSFWLVEYYTFMCNFLCHFSSPCWVLTQSSLCKSSSAVWLCYYHHSQDLHILCVHRSVCHLWCTHAERGAENESRWRPRGAGGGAGRDQEERWRGKPIFYNVILDSLCSKPFVSEHTKCT